MIDVIEKTLDVQIQNPVVLPAATAGFTNSVYR
jgi:hypothetical protein